MFSVVTSMTMLRSVKYSSSVLMSSKIFSWRLSSCLLSDAMNSGSAKCCQSLLGGY